MMKSGLLLLILLSLLGCGASTEDKLNEAILDAEIALGSSNCQYAIDVLESYGRVNTHARYLKTLSSAYACRAGYSTPTFFTNDLSLTATPAPLGGTTIYSTSGATVSNPLENDTSFVDLQTAINILLYAGNLSATTEPFATNRALKFSSDEAADMNSQLLFMELVQLGKYMRVYGNGNSLGVKGAGNPLLNTCFTTYTDAALPVLVGTTLPAHGGACQGINAGHAQLAIGIGAATRKKRLCHGVVLMNGIFDILPTVVNSASGGSLAGISSVSDASITAAKLVVTTAFPAIGAVLTTANQTNCENDAIVSVASLEGYFALMMESMYQ